MNRILTRIANYLKLAESTKFKKEDIQSIADSTNLKFQQGLNNMLERYDINSMGINIEENNLPITQKVEELQKDRDFKLEFDNAIEHFDEQFAIDIIFALQEYFQNKSLDNSNETTLNLSENEILQEIDNIIQIMNNVFSQEEINYDECNRYSLPVKDIYDNLKDKFDL
jgi:hypothetical protein